MDPRKKWPVASARWAPFRFRVGSQIHGTFLSQGVINIQPNPYNALLRYIQVKFLQIYYPYICVAWRVLIFRLFMGGFLGSDPGINIHPVWANSLCEVKIVLGHPTFLAHCALCVKDQSPDSRSIVCNRHYTNTWSKERFMQECERPIGNIKQHAFEHRKSIA